MVKTVKIALAGLIALAAAAALFAAAGAASDARPQEPSAAAQQPATASNPRPSGADWTCGTATLGHRFLGGHQRSLINYFHYEVTEQVVCTNAATQETWNGPQTRRRYWVCRQDSDDAIVECPS